MSGGVILVLRKGFLHFPFSNITLEDLIDFFTGIDMLLIVIGQ